MTPCTVPAAGRPNFTLADNEIEMGVGIHGEPGRRRVPLASADAIAAELLEAILKDLAPSKGSEVLLLVNGFGATPLIELYLMVNSAKRILDGAGVAEPVLGHPVHGYVGRMSGGGSAAWPVTPPVSRPLTRSGIFAAKPAP